jgi:hypothetical protein
MKINSKEELDKLTVPQLEHIYTAMLNEASFDPSAHNDEQAKEEVLRNLSLAKETLAEWERRIASWIQDGRPSEEDEDATEALEVAKRGVENLVDWQY